MQAKPFKDKTDKQLVYNGVRHRCIIKFKIWFPIPSRTNIKITAFLKDKRIRLKDISKYIYTWHLHRSEWQIYTSIRLRTSVDIIWYNS